MEKCPTCNSEIAANNVAIIAMRIEAEKSWDDFEGDSPRWGAPEGHTFHVSMLGEVKVVKKSLVYDSTDSYGDIPQGTTFETFIILEHDSRFFKKVGVGDSYGSVTWNGPFNEVFPKAKTVTVYEFDN